MAGARVQVDARVDTRSFEPERATGIEPALQAWEARVLPLNYARMRPLSRRGAPPSDRDLKSEIAARRFTLAPYDAALVQPSSVDVRLDRYFRVFQNHRYTHIDPAVQQDELAGRLEGKSSLGRLGLLTHSTAGFIDPGFTGHVTLELSNVATLPITLWPGMKIGQLCLFRLSSPAEHPYGSAVYGSRYQGQRGPTPSRSWQNFSRSRTS